MAQNSIPSGAPSTQALLEAYLAAVYRVELDDGTTLPLHVGQPAPAALERAMPATAWTLVTAWNPQSVPRSGAANDAADAMLRAELDALGLAKLRAGGGSDDGDWEERGWLVAGLDAAAADALARRYGQAGILHWAQGQPVRLRMYRPRPGGDATPHVDWPLL
ncbi:DUF3293 domain-containing protein [Pseudoxanthomonas suwonensis]|uniref:DUF3293 domain-containing protein n=1 Tax=Pseudoxanthomonas suwonensis TaxID=314722 RepID=A0A0E3Z1B3_9GAMM|nr:DUF3293 domain-containing protein [Pseudoxanthomonas suwonensis]AKC85549.1 hypothetical protein WQ53_00980 [Pseudoxanthomonas suwonensis]